MNLPPEKTCNFVKALYFVEWWEQRNQSNVATHKTKLLYTNGLQAPPPLDNEDALFHMCV